MKRSEKKRLKEEEREQRLREREIARLRRKKNRPLTFVSAFFILIFVSLIGYLAYFDAIKSEDFINSPYNTRQDTFSDRVVPMVRVVWNRKQISSFSPHIHFFWNR